MRLAYHPYIIIHSILNLVVILSLRNNTYFLSDKHVIYKYCDKKIIIHSHKCKVISLKILIIFNISRLE